jgi:hypothetical protein
LITLRSLCLLRTLLALSALSSNGQCHQRQHARRIASPPETGY